MSMDNSMMVFFLSMLATYSIVGFVWWLLHVVAAWRIFTKAGEAGWKSIIPIYSTYITYKISWKKKNLFWATLAATVLVSRPGCSVVKWTGGFVGRSRTRMSGGRGE